MSDHSVRQYIFGEFILEPREGRLSRINVERVELAGKPFEVLVLLVENQGHLVTREDLLAKVWPDTAVTDQSLTEVVSRIRKTLDPENPEKYIETVPRKGYRFIIPVAPVLEPVRAAEVSLPNNEKRRLWLVALGFLIALIAAVISFGTLHFWRSAVRESEIHYKSAVHLEAEGKDNQAIQEFGMVQRPYPKFDEANLKSAWLLYQDEEDIKANRALCRIGGGNDCHGLVNQSIALIVRFRDALGIEDKHRVTVLKAQGIKKLLDGQTSGALEAFQSAADADRGDIDALIFVANTAVDLADTANNKGRFAEADDALAKCLALDRENPLCGYERINALTYEDHFEAAIAEYDRLRKLSNNPWLRQPVGYAQLAQNNLDESRNHFDSLRALGPSGSLVHFMAALDGIAATLVYQGKLSDARVKLQSAIDVADTGYEKADYLILMAMIDALHRNPKPAKDELNMASKISNSPDLDIKIARTFAIADDHDDAQRVLDRQHKTTQGEELKDSATKPFIDGIDSFYKGDLRLAAKLLDNSFSLDSDPETAYFLAKAEMGMGNWDAAINHLDFISDNKAKVLVKSVASLIPMAEFELSKCYSNKGNEPEARKHLASAHRIWLDADSELKAQLVGR